MRIWFRYINIKTFWICWPLQEVFRMLWMINIYSNMFPIMHIWASLMKFNNKSRRTSLAPWWNRMITFSFVDVGLKINLHWEKKHYRLHFSFSLRLEQKWCSLRVNNFAYIIRCCRAGAKLNHSGNAVVNKYLAKCPPTSCSSKWYSKGMEILFRKHIFCSEIH